MTETWPTSPHELRQAYESAVVRAGKSGAVAEMARTYDVPVRTVYGRLSATGVRATRLRPDPPSPEALSAEYEAACTEHGRRAAISTLARRYEVDNVTVHRWLREAGLWVAKGRAAPIRPITSPCPCGAVAFSRYQGQDPPLCMNCYARAYNADNPPARSGRIHAIAFKEGKPCTDCGGVFHQAAMEYDHVPERGPKLFNLGQSDRSVEAVKAEIAKCDIVCANCHRIRTWNRNRGLEEEPAS
jgi:hypothetical protein